MRKARLTAVLGFCLAFAIMPDPALAQGRTAGCGSPIVHDSSINQLRIVCNANNLQLQQVVRRLNELAARKVLNAQDLGAVAATLNAKLDKISNDTDEILLQLSEIRNRLDLANTNPERARQILRPYLDAATDISNRSLNVSDFLDVNGRVESRTIFSVTGICQLFVTPPHGTGFIIRISVRSDRDSVIWHSNVGTQGRYKPIPLATGVYQFVMEARRGAGQHAATIAARCE